MDNRSSNRQGYLVAEPSCPNSFLDISFLDNMESFYNNYSDPKKLTKLTGVFPSSHTKGSSSTAGWGALESQTQVDLLTSNKEPIDLCTITAVSVDESELLDEFIALAPDFGSSGRHKELSDLTSSIGSSLSELETMEPCFTMTQANSQPSSLFASSSSTSKSLPTSLLSGSLQDQEYRYSAKRRIQSAYGANTSHGVASKSLKVMKQKAPGTVQSFVEPSGGDRWNSQSHRPTMSSMRLETDRDTLRQRHRSNSGKAEQETVLSRHHPAYVGSSNIVKQERTPENICKDCKQILSAKCLINECLKKDSGKSKEVLCPRCGNELTAKCLLQVC